ncbi:hypothetical protein AC1031_020082 [Aphanomyces cochlioides]|nr:hypothetical protein AC1031_020082 [Aphanomyces cochlioides]
MQNPRQNQEDPHGGNADRPSRRVTARQQEWAEFFDMNPLQRFIQNTLHGVAPAPPHDENSNQEDEHGEILTMEVDMPPLATPAAAPSTPTDHSAMDVCLESIEIKGLPPSIYQPPPTAYMPHHCGEEPLQMQRRFVRDKLWTLRTMKQRLRVVPSDFFSTQLVLHRDAIDRVPWPYGGLVHLGGVESLVMDFLTASELVTGSLVCRRWSGLCRHDGLWEKFLVSPVEHYPLRRLLSCPPSIPAIQVYMLFSTSALATGPIFGQAFDALEDESTATASTVPLTAASKDHLRNLETMRVESVHIRRVELPRAKRIDKMFNPTTFSFRGGESLKSYLVKHAPLPPLVLKSFAHQLLHACVALEKAGLKHTDISTKNIVVHAIPPTSLNESTSGTSGIGAGAASVPLLQLDGHYCLEKISSSTTTTTEDQDEALFWTIMYDPRNRDGGGGGGNQLVKHMLCGYMYCVLDMALEGRSANLRQHSLMYCMNVDRQYLARELRSLLECAAYLLYTKAPLASLLHHPYFQPVFPPPHVPALMARGGMTEAFHPYTMDLTPLGNGSDNVSYMTQVNAWYTEALPKIVELYPIHAFASVPTSMLGMDMLHGDVGELQLVRTRYNCIAAPMTATSNWMKILASSQRLSLKRLDLSRLELSSSTILQGLSLLPYVMELKLPKAMLREANLEHVISAFANGLLPSLTTVEEAFCVALTKMEASYTSQLDMVDFLLQGSSSSATGSGRV